jgi:hypothetical protein
MTLPNFLVIGAAKAGTTSLYHYLDEHPQVFMSPVKETNYFAYHGSPSDLKSRGQSATDFSYVDPVPPDERFRYRTPAEYEELFAGAGHAEAIGEVSPLYLESPVAAANIHRTIPEVRLIASLRDPVERAWSDYMLQVRYGRVSTDFRTAFDPESHYVRMGFYARLLEPYYARCAREQIRIVLFEDFTRNPMGVMCELYRFLGVDKDFAPNVSERHNVGLFPRSETLNAFFTSQRLRRLLLPVVPRGLKKTMRRVRSLNLGPPPQFPAELQANLRELYREDVLSLQDLIGRDLSEWLRPIPSRSPA